MTQEQNKKNDPQIGAKCAQCGKVANEAIVKYWTKGLPFYNKNNHTWYCGCKGWD